MSFWFLLIVFVFTFLTNNSGTKFCFLLVALNCICFLELILKTFFPPETAYKFKALKKVAQLAVINSLEKVSHNFFGITILLTFSYKCCSLYNFELKSHGLKNHFTLIFREVHCNILLKDISSLI